MSAFGDLFRHWLSYFSGRALMLLGGLISLPIMTRLLTIEEYGVMSLVFLGITLATSVGSLGFPQATTRYFADNIKQGDEFSLLRFCTTMTIGSLFAGMGSIILFSLISMPLSDTKSFAQVVNYLNYALILIVIRVVSSVFLQIFRGDQATLVFNLFTLANRYVSLACCVFLIIYVYESVEGVFVGTMFVELLIALVGLIYLLRVRRFGLVRPSSVWMVRAIKYGMPLIVADFLVSLVSSGDRFIIQYFLGSEAVATYSVAYDISDYVAILFASPLQLAILPIIFTLWSKEGARSTRIFVNKAVNLSLIVAIPIVAGFSVVGPDVVTILASDKYAESSKIIPFVALGVMLASLNFLLSIGLMVQEKTKVFMILNGSAAAVNFCLNLILVQLYGILGAAYSTMITYIYLNFVTYRVSRRYLQIQIDWKMVLNIAFSAGVMTAVLLRLDEPTEYMTVNVLIRVMIGSALYFGTLSIIEVRFRRFVSRQLATVVYKRR